MDVYVLIGTILCISYSLKKVIWFLKYSWCCGPMDWSEGMCHGSLHGVWWAVPKGAGRSNLQRLSCWCFLPTNEWSLPLGPARLWLRRCDISGIFRILFRRDHNDKKCMPNSCVTYYYYWKLILVVPRVHVLNSAVWQTKPCPNHAFPSQNSPLLANLQMYSNLHSYAKSSSNEPKHWHIIMAYHGHMKFEPRSFLKTFSTTFTAWRGAFDHFSCCNLAAKYAHAKPRIEIHKSTNTLGFQRNVLLLNKLFV